MTLQRKKMEKSKHPIRHMPWVLGVGSGEQENGGFGKPGCNQAGEDCDPSRSRDWGNQQRSILTRSIVSRHWGPMNPSGKNRAHKHTAKRRTHCGLSGQPERGDLSPRNGTYSSSSAGHRNTSISFFIPPSLSLFLFLEWQCRPGHGDTFEELRFSVSQNSSPKVGDFQITTFLWINLLFSLLRCSCQKQIRQLLFKGEKEIKIDLKRSSPAWYSAFVLIQNSDRWTR